MMVLVAGNDNCIYDMVMEVEAVGLCFGSDVNDGEGNCGAINVSDVLC